MKFPEWVLRSRVNDFESRPKRVVSQPNTIFPGDGDFDRMVADDMDRIGEGSAFDDPCSNWEE